MDEKDQNVLDERGSSFPPQPASAGDDNAVGTETVVAEREVLATKAQTVTLTPEQANALFPVETYSAYAAEELHKVNIDNFKESNGLLGKFTAHLYDRVLPALNESIERLKRGEEINGFSGKKQVGAYLESVGYTADLVRQWNKRYRDRMAKLKKALGFTDAKLTPEQRELRDTLVQQGYKNPDATRLAKAAEGNSVIEKFNWVMEHRASEINGTAIEERNSKPATDTRPATEPVSVTTVTHEDEDPPVVGDTAADQLREILANEPDRDVARKSLEEHLRAYLRQFANDRITIKELKVTVEFAGRDHRIMPDDFVEKRERDTSPVLCKCTGVAEFMQRRKVQEWREGKWQKERVVFFEHEHEYRVVSEEVARRIAPEAFPSSPLTKPPEGL